MIHDWNLQQERIEEANNKTPTPVPPTPEPPQTEIKVSELLVIDLFPFKML
jgi:hypothetical protein